MKTLKSTLVIGSMFISGSLLANSTWVETALWKAPQATNFSIKLKGREKLADECSIYKKAVFKEDGSLTYIAKNPERLAYFRKLIDPVTLVVEAKSYDRIEKTIKLEEGEQKPGDLPYYVQNEATTGVLLGDSEKIVFISDENSYTNVSDMQKLEPSQIDLKQDANGNFVVLLQNRDVACDLYEGKGHVSLTVPAYVIIGEKGFENLNQFYNKKLLPEISDLVLSKTEGLTSKAIRLGYRTGKVLEEEFQAHSAKDTEKQLTQVLKALFNPKNLETLPSLIKAENKLTINLDDRTEAQSATVTLEF